jgi:hypothetical protein
MRLLIPFTDELVELLAQGVCRRQISHTCTLALQDADPLFDLIHPCAMPWGKVHRTSRMFGDPDGYFFSMIRPDMITDEMNGLNVCGNLLVSRFEKAHAFLLALAFITVSIDLAGPGVIRGEEIERPGAFVLMLGAVGNVLGLGQQGRGKMGPWL